MLEVESPRVVLGFLHRQAAAIHPDAEVRLISDAVLLSLFTVNDFEALSRVAHREWNSYLASNESDGTGIAGCDLWRL